MNSASLRETFPSFAEIDPHGVDLDDDHDDESVISELTENSTSDIDEEDAEDDGGTSLTSISGVDDASYDSIDEIDEEELENLLKVSRELQTKRCFSEIDSSNRSREEIKRRKMHDRNLSISDYDTEVEQTADAIFSLFLERLFQSEDSGKSISTSCCSSHESSMSFRFHSTAFNEIAVDSSLNSFWNTILNNQA